VRPGGYVGCGEGPEEAGAPGLVGEEGDEAGGKVGLGRGGVSQLNQWPNLRLQYAHLHLVVHQVVYPNLVLVVLHPYRPPSQVLIPHPLVEDGPEELLAHPHPFAPAAHPQLLEQLVAALELVDEVHVEVELEGVGDGVGVEVGEELGEVLVEALAVEVAVVAVELLDVEGSPVLVDLVVDRLRLALVAHVSAPCLLDQHGRSSALQHLVHVDHQRLLVVAHQGQHLRLATLDLEF